MKRLVLVSFALFGVLGLSFVEEVFAGERCDYNSSSDGTCGTENLVATTPPSSGVQDVRNMQATGLHTPTNGSNGQAGTSGQAGSSTTTTGDSTGANNGTDSTGGNTGGGTGGSTGGAGAGSGASANTGNTGSGGAGKVRAIVTEDIPGAGCVEIKGGGPGSKRYQCDVGSGFATVQGMFAGLIKYTTFLTALIGLLMVVYSGFQYATSAGDGDSQKKAVIRIQKLIGGLILLFLTGFILNTIAPWIYR